MTMRCPKCGKEIEYVIGTQLVHVNVKVSQDGEFFDSISDDLYDDAYEFEDPVGDFACPECREFIAEEAYELDGFVV